MTSSSRKKLSSWLYASSTEPVKEKGALFLKPFQKPRTRSSKATACALIFSISAVWKGKMASFFWKVLLMACSTFRSAWSRYSMSEEPSGSLASSMDTPCFFSSDTVFRSGVMMAFLM